MHEFTIMLCATPLYRNWNWKSFNVFLIVARMRYHRQIELFCSVLTTAFHLFAFITFSGRCDENSVPGNFIFAHNSQAKLTVDIVVDKNTIYITYYLFIFFFSSFSSYFIKIQHANGCLTYAHSCENRWPQWKKRMNERKSV